MSITTTLQQDYRKFFDEKQLYDMQIIVGTEEIKFRAHIAFVAARSEYLRTMILEARNKQQQQQQPIMDDNEKEPLLEIQLPNARPEVFERILKFIYTDLIYEPDKPCDNLVIFYTDVYQLASLFLMRSLKDFCIEEIKTEINKLNILEALVYAVEKRIQIVQDICMQILNENQEILNVVVMSNEFCALDKPLLVEIMQNKLNLSRSIKKVDTKTKMVTSTMENDMKSFFESSGKDFCDIDLVLDGHTIKAHKSILYARTRYFQGMFRNFMPPDNKVNISIGDILPPVEAFQSLLRYIYCGKTALSPQDAIYLLEASDFYGFSNNDFNSLCNTTLKCFNQASVLEVLEASDYTRNLEVKKRALEMIAKDVAYFSRLPKFSSLSQELLLEIINVAVSLKELIVWNQY